MELNFKRIPQNSRTIIIERFNDNDQIPNLCKLLKGQEASDAVDKISEELCVKSFEEFKEKFKPTVYEIYRTDESGNLQVNYSLEKIEKVNAKEISLCEHEFYRAVHDVALEKSASATDNNNIDYTKLYEAFDPKLIYTRARRRRADVNQFVTNALEAKENGNPDGVKKWLLMAKNTYDSVKEEYAGSALRILPLALRDTEILREARGIKSDTAEMIESETTNQELLPCSIKWDADGNLVTEPIEESETPETLAIENKSGEVLQITHKNWETVVNSMPEGSVDKELFLSVYSEKANSKLANLDTNALIKREKDLKDMYTAANQSFCNAVSYLVQKVASLEQFFIHAADDDGIVESGVIIANCSVSDIIENQRYVKEFLKIASVNEKDRIWFAVFPAAIDNSGKWSETYSKGGDAIDIENFYSNSSNETKSNDGIKRVKIADINIISELFAEYGILSFFNFNACEETSFKSFGANLNIINEYNKETADIKRPDATVLAYPNFTIIPKNKRKVGDMDLYTPPVYIDAAYVAAGIVVSTQCMKIQKKKFGKKVVDGRPFIRFDLEDERSNQAFIAKFNPESRLNMDKTVAATLSGKDGNAFCFRSDSLEKNAFVYTARTLSGKKIYWYIVQQYLTFLIERTYNKSKLTSAMAKQFVNSVYNMVTNESDDSVVNQILHKGEEFRYDEETKKFSLKFNGISEPVDFEIEVGSDEEN